MSIAKAGLFSAVATAARLLSGLLVIKLVALFAGPEGVAKLGQFMSLMSLLVVFAGGGLGAGIVKYVAEYQGDSEKIERLLGAGFFYTLVASSLMGVAALVFSKPLTALLLGDMRYESLIWILALAQCLIAIHNYIVAIINGFMEVRRVAMIHIIGSIVSVILTGLLAYFFQLYGALLALVLGQAALVFVSLYYFRRSSYFDKVFFRPRFDRQKALNLAKFSAMTLTSAMLSPLVQIWVRNHLVDKFSWTDAGYWQAVSKVSDAYLLFISMAISMYYLPKLSSITDKALLRVELVNAYYFVMPIVAVLAFAIYIFRDWVTVLLFSADFISAGYLYGPQLIGDVLKIASFILSYIMLAKAMTKLFICSEIIFSITYVGFVYFFSDIYGLVGVMYAFVFNYFLYLIFVTLVTRWHLKTS